MSKATYGPKIRDRANRLLEAILDFVNFNLDYEDDINLKFQWQNNATPPVLYIETTLEGLHELMQQDVHPGSLSIEEIREALKRMEDFMLILNDHRVQHRGSGKWIFSLKLWSSEKTENLKQFKQDWDQKRTLRMGRRYENHHPSYDQNTLIKRIYDGQAKVFLSSDNHETLKSIETSIKISGVIKIYSISANFLWKESYFQILRNRLLSKTPLQVQFCFANHLSPEVLLRLSHEGEVPFGLDSLGHRFKEKFLKLQSEVADESRFAVRRFDHYPTYSLLMFDQETYIYMYPFKGLGNLSPTFYFDQTSAATQFFQQQFNQIWEDASSLGETVQPIQVDQQHISITRTIEDYQVIVTAQPLTKT